LLKGISQCSILIQVRFMNIFDDPTFTFKNILGRATKFYKGKERKFKIVQWNFLHASKE
jgi:hypothetical protein